MNKYAVFCSANPCGTVKNKWSIQKRYWTGECPKNGVDINEAYSILRWEESKHTRCGCQFVVKELGE